MGKILGLNFSFIGGRGVGISFVMTKSHAMPHSSSMVSSRKELLNLPGAMTFVGTAKGHLTSPGFGVQWDLHSQVL